MAPSHRFVLVAAAIFVCAGAPRPWAASPDPPDVDALLQHLDDRYRSKSSIARIQIDVTSTRSTRSMRLRAWTRGEEEVLVLIEAPPREAGTATLRVGNNLWNYLPKIARAIRVPPAEWLLNPSDRSGIVVPGLTYTFSDAVSLLGTFYLPYGRPPKDGVVRSEYEAAPLSGLLQLRLYF